MDRCIVDHDHTIVFIFKWFDFSIRKSADKTNYYIHHVQFKGRSSESFLLESNPISFSTKWKKEFLERALKINFVRNFVFNRYPLIFWTFTDRYFWRKNPKFKNIYKWCNAVLCIRKTRSVMIPRFGVFPGFANFQENFKGSREKYKKRLREMQNNHSN